MPGRGILLFPSLEGMGQTYTFAGRVIARQGKQAFHHYLAYRPSPPPDLPLQGEEFIVTPQVLHHMVRGVSLLP